MSYPHVYKVSWELALAIHHIEQFHYSLCGCISGRNDRRRLHGGWRPAQPSSRSCWANRYDGTGPASSERQLQSSTFAWRAVAIKDWTSHRLAWCDFFSHCKRTRPSSFLPLSDDCQQEKILENIHTHFSDDKISFFFHFSASTGPCCAGVVGWVEASLSSLSLAQVMKKW